MRELPDKLTPLPPGKFTLALLRAWASYFGQGPGLRSLACVVAQLVLESGRAKQPDGSWLWGQGYAPGLGAHNFNWGNIKHKGDDDPNDFQFFECAEWIFDAKKGRSVFHRFKPRHPQCKFRAYDSAEEGFSDYLNFLIRRRDGAYLEAWNRGVYEGDPITFARELGAAGYYTAPVERYTKTLVSIFESVLPTCQEVIESPKGQLVFAPEKEARDRHTLDLVALTLWENFRSEYGDGVASVDEVSLRETITTNLPDEAA